MLGMEARWRLIPHRFFTYLLLMFLIHQMAVALFRSVGAIARNEVLANAASCAPSLTQ